MTPEQERERAAEARAGGNALRITAFWLPTFFGRATLAEEAEKARELAAGTDMRDPTERDIDAFDPRADWPIYRAAMRTLR